MREQIDRLVKLQEIETKAAGHRDTLDKIPTEIQSLKQDKLSLEERIKAQGDRIEELKKEYRDQESESRQIGASISKSQDKLRSVKTNKEYQSLLKEIDELKKMNSGIEDRMLEILDLQEAEEEKLEASKKEKDATADAIDTDIEELEGKIAEIQDVVGELATRSEEIEKGIEKKILGIFNRVKNQSRGVAIVPVIKEVCQGCNVNIPPQLFNDLQRYDQLYFCPNCQRIMFHMPNGTDSSEADSQE